VAARPAAGGTVSGRGSFPDGRSVTVGATANSGYKFFGWTGSVTDTLTPYSFAITQNMNFTANFRPCFATNKANPLPFMALAPPGTNIAGATYGNTRKKADGTAVFHNGIDLAGAVGTPIYAQFGGTVGKVVSEQPNRIDNPDNKNYPTGYSGDMNNAGNRIYVNSTVGGNTVNNGYWHLQADTPIANNPRTGQPWATGDAINAGEVIGYIGITGNANADVPHLHLTTSVNGANSDPATYLNATISTTTTNITTPCD